MTIGFGSTMTPAEINGFISVFCHFYEHHEDFDYSDDVIEFDTCNLEILNGLYSDEELIVETPLKVKISPFTNLLIFFIFFFEIISINSLTKLQFPHNYS